MHKTLSLPAAIFLFLLLSCSNKDKKNPCRDGPGVPCPLIDNLLFRFSIKDKSTGQDLFFSTPPTYPFSALNVTGTPGYPAEVQVDTLYSRHDFEMVAGQGRGVYTVYFQIANTKPDTLVYTANTYQASCCEDSTVLTNITFNGQMVSRSLNLATANGLTPVAFYK
jgi:hypothetical protein